MNLNFHLICSRPIQVNSVSAFSVLGMSFSNLINSIQRGCELFRHVSLLAIYAMIDVKEPIKVRIDILQTIFHRQTPLRVIY